MAEEDNIEMKDLDRLKDVEDEIAAEEETNRGGSRIFRTLVEFFFASRRAASPAGGGGLPLTKGGLCKKAASCFTKRCYRYMKNYCFTKY